MGRSVCGSLVEGRGQDVLSFAVGILCFAAAAVVSASLMGLGARAITTPVAAASLVVGVTVAWLAARATRQVDDASADRETLQRPRGLELVVMGVFLAATLRQFLWLAVSDGAMVAHRNPYNYGDLPLHWTYIAYLAEGAHFWPANPIFGGTRLSYPIGADLLAVLFVKLGIGIGPLLRVTGVVASAVLYVSLRRWGGLLAVAAFVFSGGFDVTRLAPGAFFRPDDPELPWKSVLLALFVPQRGFLYALPAGLLLFWSARDKLLRDRRGLEPWVEGLLWGAMPLFHVHTFLVFSLVFGAWSLARRRVAAALPSLAVALPLAVFGVWQVTDGFRASRLVWWKPGWMIDDANPLVFLLANFGLLLPLSVAMMVRPARDPVPETRRPTWAAVAETRIVAGTALALFLSLFFVMLAPWEWDNTKALVWAVLLALGALPAWLAERPRGIRIALVGLLLAPGVPAAVGGLLGAKPLPVYEEEEKQAVCSAMAQVPITERVATAQTFKHPVGLCGRAIAAGYSGHLWSHGLNSGPAEQALGRLMRGEPGWEGDARTLGVRWLFWGEREGRDFSGSTRPWAREDARVWQGEAGTLYRLAD
jgi:hypothetical protein